MYSVTFDQLTIKHWLILAGCVRRTDIELVLTNTVICRRSLALLTWRHMKPTLHHRPVLLLQLMSLNPRHRNTATWHQQPYNVSDVASTPEVWIQTG